MGRSSTTFGPGNTAALKHGSRSPRFQDLKRQGLGVRIRRELRSSDKAWLERLILDVETRLASYREYLIRVGGPVGRNGQLRGCLDRLQKDEATLIRLHAIWDGRPDEPDWTAALQRLREASQ